MAGQRLATVYSFLGRPADALRSFSNRGSERPDASLPSPSQYQLTPAADWAAAQAHHYRVVMINEAHHAPQTRLLTLALLAKLRAQGYTHFAAETFALLNNPLPAGYPTSNTGYYTNEPVLAELVREAKRLGYVLLPYEPEGGPEQTQQERETGMAQILANVLTKSPNAKLLVHAGYAHIGESAEGLPGNAKPMAMELARITGLALLTLDQTSTRPYEADDIATTGRQLAQQFSPTVPSILQARKDGHAWSARPGLYDASVLLPTANASAIRPNWLTLGGTRSAIAVDLAPCIGHLPCLAEARYASEGDDAIPADQFVMLADSEAATPLFLAPGRYRLRLLGNDNLPLAQRTLEVADALPHPSGTP
jgi:hypothetical protein